jgi:hypothetical protein
MEVKDRITYSAFTEEVSPSCMGLRTPRHLHASLQIHFLKFRLVLEISQYSVNTIETRSCLRERERITTRLYLILYQIRMKTIGPIFYKVKNVHEM